MSTPALYSEGSGFKDRPEDHILCVLWFSFVTQGKFWDSTLKQVMAPFLNILSNASFTDHSHHQCYTTRAVNKHQSRNNKAHQLEFLVL
jgi:hypothetical protein